MQTQFQVRGRLVSVDLERQGNGFRAVIDGQSYELEILASQPGELSLLFDGRPVRLAWSSEGGKKWISQGGCAYLIEPPAAGPARRSQAGASGAELRAPMPAQVRVVAIAEGDLVEQGQTLLTLEAMKMEIRLAAPRSGRVARLSAQVGQTVQRDQLLVVLEDPPASA